MNLRLYQFFYALVILLSCCIASSSGISIPGLEDNPHNVEEKTTPRGHRHLGYHDFHKTEQYYDDDVKDDRRGQFICSINGGLDVVRLSSSKTRHAFKSALEDVEFIRQYIAEAALNNNMNFNNAQSQSQGSYLVKTAVGMTLEELSQTLDAKARNITSPNATTLTAGLGYADDREDRHIDRYVSLANEPIVGTKQTDLDLIEPVADVFPWLVDKSTNTGRNAQGADRLYVAAWIGTYGEAWMYYPALQHTYGHPYGSGDILGDSYDSKEEEFVKPNLPPAVVEKAYFTSPYPDSANPGLSLITAQAPVYLTGSFHGFEYNQTYIASTGVDISVTSMSSFLNDLEGTVTEGSFAMLVSFDGFRTILISQSTVDKIYPEYTGMEESRVTYDKVLGSITSDRRNQPYKVSDTIFEPITDLSNSPDWKSLESDIRELKPGERSSTLVNVTLTGEEDPTSFHVIYERWDEVADWVFLLFVPEQELNSSVDVEMVEPSQGNDLHLRLYAEGVDTSNSFVYNKNDEDFMLLTSSHAAVETIVRNTGFLDVALSIKGYPAWLDLIQEYKEEYVIPPGRNLTLTFKFLHENLPGDQTRSALGMIAFTVRDHDYSNCFFKQVLTAKVFVDVYEEPNLNQLGKTRAYGFTLCAIVIVSSFGWSAWAFWNASHRVIRASQPIFLHMLCAGISVMGLSLIPKSIDDSLATMDGSSVACMAFPWLLSIGFSITFSALFSKVWRLNQVVKGAKNYKRVQISTRHVMVPFVVICTLNVIILSIWSGVDPLVWVRKPSGSASEATNGSIGSEDTYGFCSFNDSSLGLTCLILLLLVNFGALVMALVQLYRARELSTEYCEGKFIAVAMGSMVQVFLTGLPILVLVTDDPNVSYFVESTIVFTLAMSILLMTFLPKFFMVMSDKKIATITNRSITVNGLDLPPGNDEASNHATGGPFISFAKDGEENSEYSGHDKIPESNPDVLHKLISDITMSITTSEFESPQRSVVRDIVRKPIVEASKNAPTIPVRFPSVMEDIAKESHEPSQSELHASDRKRVKSGCAPKLPMRLPSVIEDITDECESSREPMVNDDIREETLAASTSAPKIPVRLTSVYEDVAQEFCNESIGAKGDTVYHAGLDISHSHTKSPLQLVVAVDDGRNQDKSITGDVSFLQTVCYDDMTNAAVPRRLPSLVEPNNREDLQKMDTTEI